MKRPGALAWTFALATGLGAPAAADVQQGPPHPPAASTLPFSVWSVDNAGGLHHLQSGLACPSQFRSYDRTRIVIYDRFGLDVSCNYLARGTSDLTVYLTRRSGTTVADATKEAQREVMQYDSRFHPKLISETHNTVGGKDFDVTLYTVDLGHSAIWMTDLDGWTLEYRVTYAVSAEPRVLEDIASMTAAVEQTAGTRLGLCAQAPEPVRDGQPITDGKDLHERALLTALLGSASQGLIAEGKAPPPAPRTWCVESAVGRNGAQLLYWRAVDSSGHDAGADRVTAMTVGQPPTMTAQEDSLTNLVEKAHGKPQAWTATMERNGRTVVYGYFTGRPSEEALSALTFEALLGKAQALVSYQLNGKQIQIGMPPQK